MNGREERGVEEERQRGEGKEEEEGEGEEDPCAGRGVAKSVPESHWQHDRETTKREAR